MTKKKPAPKTKPRKNLVLAAWTGTAQEPPTDPYGLLEYCVGNEDDFICFDFAVTDKGVWLHAVVNSETAHFIQDFQAPVLVSRGKAVAEACEMVNAALDWCVENEVTHDEKGWNQDPHYFARAVAYELMDAPHKQLFELQTRVKYDAVPGEGR